MDLTQAQHLVQIPQLIDLTHGLRAQGNVAEALVLAHSHDLLQKRQGDVHGLLPGALHEGAGVDDHPGGSHLIGHQAAGGDIADGLLLRFRVRVCQVDKVGGVERQSNAVLLGLPTQRHGGVLLHPHPFAALVLIAVQAQLLEPSWGVHRGLVGEALCVARRSECCTHSLSPPADRSRKGTSTA